jgi:hypothetical protein
MDQAELNRLCNQSGVEGSLWRLIRTWDPDKLVGWVQAERARGATPEMLVHCVAEVMSGAAFVLAQQIGGDKRGAMLGDNGLVGQLRARLPISSMWWVACIM